MQLQILLSETKLLLVSRSMLNSYTHKISIFSQRKKKMIAPRIELGTFCVLDRCDNHYTMHNL